jgi:hypothetical protein
MVFIYPMAAQRTMEDHGVMSYFPFNACISYIIYHILSHLWRNWGVYYAIA